MSSLYPQRRSTHLEPKRHLEHCSDRHRPRPGQAKRIAELLHRRRPEQGDRPTSSSQYPSLAFEERSLYQHKHASILAAARLLEGSGAAPLVLRIFGNPYSRKFPREPVSSKDLSLHGEYVPTLDSCNPPSATTCGSVQSDDNDFPESLRLYSNSSGQPG